MKLDWNEVLDEALNKEGSFGDTFTRFYNYSFSNQILLSMQGVRTPVATYKNWQALGRQVKKGSKAKYIVRPVMVKEQDTDEEYSLRGFHFIKCIFEMKDTDGKALPPIEHKAWKLDLALHNLDIKRIPFDMLNGNVQGYASKRNIAINETTPDPLGVALHELAHVVLGHTDKETSTQASRGIKEFQAESVRYIVQRELGVDNAKQLSESRAYLQNWLGSEKPSEHDVKEIFKAVDTILKKGKEQ